MKQFAVIGNPIAHSKSPAIHTAFAAQFDIHLSYIKLLAGKGQFSPIATGFFERGTGANITVPFKEEALRFADELSQEARIAGAVNTLSRQGGVIKGDNTDGIGLVRDICNNHGFDFTGKKVLIIGAGGAARGVILPLAGENPTSISITNRTYAKAVALAEHFSDYTSIDAIPLAELSQPFDIVINATAASLTGQHLTLSSDIFNSGTIAYDMMYARQATPFMQFADSCGATAVDGLGMLVEQAAKSFAIWHGIMPETADVITKIRATL